MAGGDPFRGGADRRRQADGLNDQILECPVCFGLIMSNRVEEHAYWHRVAASPMAHGMYLAMKTEGQ